MALEILLIVVLILANGVFSGSETAIIAARKVRLEQSAKKGDRRAKLALKLARSPGEFLSTVQIGITLIGTISGVVGGATVAQKLQPLLDQIPILSTYSQALSLGIVVTIITYLSLVIGELVPKTLALNNPEVFACYAAPLMKFLSNLTSPVVNFLGFSTRGVLKLLGTREMQQEDTLTEEEIKVLIEEGGARGTMEVAESEIASRVIGLGDRTVRSIMTPRTEIAWLDVEASWEENWQEINTYNYSRFPVGKGTLDECIGIVKLKDLIRTILPQNPIDLTLALTDPIYIADSTRVTNVLEIFKTNRTHIALVVDEYGGIEGLVTLHDLIEAIIGNPLHNDEQEEPKVIQREDGTWLLDGLVTIEEFKRLFHQESFPKEEEEHYQTLGGFVMDYLGKVPISGEYFEVNNLRLEVMDMDGVRVDKVMVTVMPDKENRFTDVDNED